MKEGSPNSNYVRIVYLKEMRSPKKSRQEDNSLTKNSLAYLSALIQQENKKRINQAIILPRLQDSQAQVFKPQNKNTQGPFDRKQSTNTESKRITLNRILNTVNVQRRKPSIHFQKQQSNTFKFTNEETPSRRHQLKESIMSFCEEIKSNNRLSQKEESKPKRKQHTDRIVYLKDSFAQSPTKEKIPMRLNLSLPKQYRPFTKQNIAYRRNFKQINNFDWGKIAERRFSANPNPV